MPSAWPLLSFIAMKDYGCAAGQVRAVRYSAAASHAGEPTKPVINRKGLSRCRPVQP